MNQYRHERKYGINPLQKKILRDRLSTVLKPDPHAVQGIYTVHSIYFDNAYDKSLREKVNGNPMRSKWRIRWYGDSTSFIALEKKSKINDLCCKKSVPLSKEQVDRILRNDLEWMIRQDTELIKELYAAMKTECIYPKVIVSYVREPFIFVPGNVRITLDGNIRSSMLQPITSLESLPDICVMEDASVEILEVKYDAFLPQIVRDLLQTESLRETANSKYCLCRRFD